MPTPYHDSYVKVQSDLLYIVSILILNVFQYGYEWEVHVYTCQVYSKWNSKLIFFGHPSILCHIFLPHIYQTVETRFGVTIQYDGQFSARITVSPELYWNNTCGLCGTLDDNRSNDFTTSDGIVVSGHKSIKKENLSTIIFSSKILLLKFIMTFTCRTMMKPTGFCHNKFRLINDLSQLCDCVNSVRKIFIPCGRAQTVSRATNNFPFNFSLMHDVTETVPNTCFCLPRFRTWTPLETAG